MKHFNKIWQRALLLLYCLCVSGGVWAQTSTSVQSGNWDDPNTWSPNVVPPNGNNIVITSGHTVTLINPMGGNPTFPTVTVNGVLDLTSQTTGYTVGGFGGTNGKIRIQDTGEGFLTVPAGTFKTNGGTLEYYGGGSLTLPTQFGSTAGLPKLIVTGTGTKYFPANVTINIAGDLQVGSVAGSADGFLNTDNGSPGLITVQGNLIVDRGNFTIQDRQITINGNTNINASATLTDNSTVSLPTAGVNTFKGTFTVANGGAVSNPNGGTEWRFEGDITNSGTFTLSSSTRYRFAKSPGILTITPNFPMTFASSNSGEGLIDCDVTIVNTTSNITFNSAVGTPLTVAAGKTLNNQNGGTGFLTVDKLEGVSGTFVNGATGQVDIVGGNIGVGSFDATPSGNTVRYFVNMAQNVRGTTYHHLILSTGSAFNKTMVGNVMVNGNLTINSNATLVPQNHNITVSGTTSITGSFRDSDLGGTNTFGVVNINSGGVLEDVTTVGANTYAFNGVLTNNGTMNTNASSNATFNFNNDIVNAGTFTLINAGTYNFNKAGGLNITPNNPMTFGFASGGGGTASALSNVTILNGNSAGDNVTFNCPLTISSPNTFTNNNANGRLIFPFNGGIDGNATASTFVNGSGAYLEYKPSSVIFATNGTINFASNPNTVEYARVGAQSVKSGGYYYLVISGGGSPFTKTAQGNIVTVNTTVENSQTLDLGSNTLYVSGNFINNKGLATCFGVTPSGTVEFDGSSGVQSITNEVLFQNLILNNTASSPNNTVSLNGNIQVNGQLTFTQGKLKIGTYDVTLNNGTPPNQLLINNASSYVETNSTGNLIRNNLYSGPLFEFPVGDQNYVRKIGFTLTGSGTGSASFVEQASLTPSAPSNVYDPPAGKWRVTCGGSTTSIKFFQPYAPSAGNASAKVYRDVTGTWDDAGISTTHATGDYTTNALNISLEKIFTLFVPIEAPIVTSATGGTPTGFTANWQSAAGATKYRLDVSTQEDFSSFLSGYNNLDVGLATSYNVNIPSANTLYFYRVRTEISGSPSNNSNTKVFSSHFRPGSGNGILPTIGYIDAGNPITFNGLSAITVEMWVKTPSVGVGMDKLAGKVNGTGTAGWLLAYDNTNNKFVFSVSDGSSLVSATAANNTAPANMMFHITGIFNGTSIYMYQNGFPISSPFSIGTPALNTSDNLTIGGSPYGGASFSNMPIDEVRIWNIARTPDDIRNNMCQKITSPSASMIAYFMLDEGVQVSVNKYVENKAPSANADGVYTVGVASVDSNAPIGDISVATYGAGSTTLTDTDAFTVDNFSAVPTGFHIYKVAEAPNLITPPTTYGSFYSSRYWGVFVADGTNPTFNIKYNYSTNTEATSPNALRFAKRSTVNDLLWHPYGGVNDGLAKVIGRRGANAGEFALGERNSVISDALSGGSIVRISGANSGVEIPKNFTDDFTIEFWAKIEDTGTGSDWKTGKRFLDASDGSNDFGVSLLSSGKVAFGVGAIDIQSSVITNNKWYHIAITRNRTTGDMKLYLNGDLEVTGNDGLFGAVDATKIRLGVDATNANELITSIDELRIWDAVLTPEEVKDNMNLRANNSHPKYTNLLTYFRFDENAGTKSEDLISGDDANFLGTGVTWLAANQALGDGYAERKDASTVNDIVKFGTMGDAATPQVELQLGSSVTPNGELVATRVHATPNNYPSSSGSEVLNGTTVNYSGVTSFMNCYWVIRNYGTNSTFDNLASIKFQIPSGNTILGGTAPSDLYLFKRPTNTTGVADWKLVGRGSAFGSIEFSAGAPAEITEFSEFVIGSSTTPLGVTLTEFKGKRIDVQQVLLQWNTTQEKQNAGFEVQRSTDGQNFTRICFLDGKGNTDIAQFYSYIDTKAEGNFYYRLLQTDRDGTSTYSPIIYVKGETAQQDIALYPNPTSRELKINVGGAVNGTMRAEVWDTQGKMIWAGKGNLKELENGLNKHLASWKEGVYLFKLYSPEKVLERKFVKKN